MKRLVTFLLVLPILYGTALGQHLPPLVAEQGYADLVLVNGKIVTMDDRSYTPDSPGTIVEAMAVNGAPSRPCYGAVVRRN